MIKERYVNFEVAKLLRDKGFDEKCFRLYNINNGLIFEYYYICNSELTETNEQVTAPTQSMACDWIEEKYNIAIVLDLTILGYEPGFFMSIKDPNTASTAFLAGKDYIPMPDGDNLDGSWSSKELAYNEALKYVLTNLV